MSYLSMEISESLIAAEGSLLFLTMCYSAFEFPANSLYTWSVSRFLRVCRQFDVILWRCSKEFTLEHYHTPGVYDSKSMTAEYFVQRSANDVPRMAFKNISTLQHCEFVAYINTRPGAKQRHFLCKYILALSYSRVTVCKNQAKFKI
jgi:hypothetical protein